MPDKEKTLADDLRRQQREEWTAAAPGRKRRLSDVATLPDPIREQMITLAEIKPGYRVLDLACGTGNPAFPIAELVGTSGSVLGLDITAAMIDIARELAQETTITNITFQVIATELDLAVDEATFDAATCRCGLMYTPNPGATLAELYRALKPGGRLAVSTWSVLEHCPFFAVPLEIMRRHITLPDYFPAEFPGAPNPFALSSPQHLIELFSAAGFRQVRVVPVPTSNHNENATGVWNQMISTMGPLIPTLTALNPTTREAIRQDVLATLERMFPDGPVQLTGEALVTVGQREA